MMAKLYVCDICENIIPEHRGISFITNDPNIQIYRKQVDICPYCYEKILNTVDRIKREMCVQPKTPKEDE